MDVRDSEPPRIGVSTWSAAGELRGTAVIEDTQFDPGPVVAPLSSGAFAVAFNSLSADSDGLGIGLVKIDADGSSAGPTTRANSTELFSQHSPDIIAIGDKIVVGWEDDSPTAARTVCIREFSSELSANGGEHCEPPSETWRSHIVLADFGGALVRAWREEDGTSARVKVAMGYSEGSLPLCCEALPDGGWPAGQAPDASEAPALAALSTSALLVVHAYGDGRLMAAVLDDEAQVLYGPVFLNDTTEPRSHPALARTLDGVYLAWREPGAVASAAGDELYLQKLDWDGETLDTATHPVLPLPRQEAHRPGDQRSPALAGACNHLLAAWDELGAGNLSSQCSHGDVVVELVPTPIFRDSP